MPDSLSRPLLCAASPGALCPASLAVQLDGATTTTVTGKMTGGRESGSRPRVGGGAEVTLPAPVSRAGDRLRLRSDLPLDLGDYEIDGLSKLLGMLRMPEGIDVHVDLTLAPG